MQTRHLAVVLASLAALAGAAPPVDTGTAWRYGSASLAVEFDKATGAWSGIVRRGQALAKPAEAAVPCRVKEDQRWLPDGKAPARLAEIRETGENTVATTVAVGQWTVVAEHTLFPGSGRIRRRAKITWNGTEQTKLRGFALGAPTIPCDGQGQWLFPGSWPPARRLAAEFVAGTRRSNGRPPVPLVYQYAEGRSLLCMHDMLRPDSDNGSVTVVEGEGALSVSQAFNTLAHMPPGSSQSVGDAWFWFVDGDADAALLRFHELLGDLGCVVPTDRPAWMESAILYSFHPGGTIGSGFHDLGGFAAATGYLDRIADLGCNAIWIMPVEDRSVYNPRDYYKFQEGLGSPEEFRALVARAHELGLHVLQDIVPHGGTNTCSRAKEHPEWLVQEEDGSTLGYWCFDFNWPEWRNYMADVARHYVRTYDVDGYRVDACTGSKIPNWNPAIPYGRASLAKLQGGLNMLRGLRGAVKESKPERGAILAESNSNVQGAVSDAIYDFGFCYSVLHGLRKSPPEQFVNDLRRWLHEQAAVGPAGLLRLRHIESHDSLRSQLWYGLEAQRALMALSVFIPGIPLVYDGCETGSRWEFQEMFRLRREFPELNGGTADYLRVPAPPGVFACLRQRGRDRCLVLINFNSAPAVFADGESDVTLPAYSYRVLRNGRMYPESEEPANKPAPPRTADTGQWAATVGNVLLDVDPATGLPAQVLDDGWVMTGAWDLYLPPACSPQGAPSLERTDRGLISRQAYGRSTLEVTYTGAGVETRWEGGVPEGAALAIPFAEGTEWSADTAEGFFADTYYRRGGDSPGHYGGIYWHPQGDNVVWDSLLHPFPASRPGCMTAGGDTKVLGLHFSTAPSRARWFDRLAGKAQLTALVAWSDPESPAPPVERLAFAFRPARTATAGGPALESVAGGWELRGAPFRLRLGKGGAIAAMGDGTDGACVRLGDVYTDAGFAPERERYAVSNDVETYAAVTGSHASFHSTLRGSHRFDRRGTPVHSVVEYAFGTGASFRMRVALRPESDAHGDRAFLALYLPTPELKTFRFEKDGEVIAEGTNGDGRQRAFETAKMAPPVVPGRIVIGDGTRTLYQLTDIRCGEASIDNVFVHGNLFFLTFLDTSTPPPVAGRWRWIEAVVTPGDAPPAAVPALAPWHGEEPATELLRDGSFEEGAELPVSLLTQTPLPGVGTSVEWRCPVGGQLVASPRHAGGRAAEVEGRKGDYRLWRQALPVERLPEGSRWRLSAWVKGEGIVHGDISWQTPTLRFAVGTDRNSYVACQPPAGTFDWQQISVELTVPPKLSSLAVEAGQNGSSGKVWFDDVCLERIGAP